MPIGSRNEIELLACGSRSRSSVFEPRRANAAARLIAVVVFPTPPFWLVIAIINSVTQTFSLRVSQLLPLSSRFRRKLTACATSANHWHHQSRRATLLPQLLLQIPTLHQSRLNSAKPE